MTTVDKKKTPIAYLLKASVPPNPTISILTRIITSDLNFL